MARLRVRFIYGKKEGGKQQFGRWREMNKCLNKSIERQIYINGSIDRQIYRERNGHIDSELGRQLDRYMDGRIERQEDILIGDQIY